MPENIICNPFLSFTFSLWNHTYTYPFGGLNVSILICLFYVPLHCSLVPIYIRYQPYDRKWKCRERKEDKNERFIIIHQFQIHCFIISMLETRTDLCFHEKKNSFHMMEMVLLLFRPVIMYVKLRFFIVFPSSVWRCLCFFNIYLNEWIRYKFC